MPPASCLSAAVKAFLSPTLKIIKSQNPSEADVDKTLIHYFGGGGGGALLPCLLPIQVEKLQAIEELLLRQNSNKGSVLCCNSTLKAKQITKRRVTNRVLKEKKDVLHNLNPVVPSPIYNMIILADKLHKEKTVVNTEGEISSEISALSRCCPWLFTGLFTLFIANSSPHLRM